MKGPQDQYLAQNLKNTEKKKKKNFFFRYFDFFVKGVTAMGLGLWAFIDLKGPNNRFFFENFFI